MKDTKLVRILNETDLNEAPESRKYMPKNVNYRQVLGGDEGTMVKQIKRLSKIAADLETIGQPIDKDLLDGFNDVMASVHKNLKRVKTK